jgi:AraC-like DNA-binding protein
MNGPDEAEGPPMPGTPLLTGYQRVTSSDINVLHDAVEPLAVGHDLQPLNPAVALDGTVNGLNLESVSLVWVRYGGEGVIVDTPPTEGEFALCAPSAPMGVEWRRHRSRPDTATGSLVLSHDESMRMTPDPVQGCLVIATSTARLRDHLQDYLGHPPASPLRFLPDGPAILPAQVTEAAWRHACAVLEHTAAGGLHPMAARSVEQSLLTAILLGLPHTATAELAVVTEPGRPARGAAGRIRAWLEAHHDQPVGVVDLAAAMGLSVRRVQDICRRHWDQTPMQLLRGIRLDHARDTLLADGTAGVAGVAAAAGFRRMDRFTAAYHRRFGETPSQTHARTGRTGAKSR